MNTPTSDYQDGSTALDERGWHYFVAGRQTGPVNTAAFVAAIRNGIIRADTPVWAAGMEQWQRAAHIPELAPDLRIGATVIPDVPPMIPGAYIAPHSGNQSGGLEWILPVNRSICAVIAGYLGLLSITGIFAPFAIVFGLLGLREIKKNPSLRGSGRAWFGIAMGAICTIAVLIPIIVRVF